MFNTTVLNNLYTITGIIVSLVAIIVMIWQFGKIIDHFKNSSLKSNIIKVVISLLVILIILGIAVGAKFLPNGDYITIVPSMTVTPSPPTLASTSTATTVPSVTPTHPKPTAIPTLRATSTLPGKTPVITPSPVKTPPPVPCHAPCDTEFPDTGVPFTINGPAIVEWADPGCGLFELNLGKSFSWSSDGHYWLYSNQTSLNANWPSHYQAYHSNPSHASCIDGPPS